jgi:hypothetical protein
MNEHVHLSAIKAACFHAQPAFCMQSGAWVIRVMQNRTNFAVREKNKKILVDESKYPMLIMVCTNTIGGFGFNEKAFRIVSSRSSRSFYRWLQSLGFR